MIFCARHHLLFLLLLASFALSAAGQERRPEIADILAGRPDLTDRSRKNEIVAQIRGLEVARKEEALQRARDLGLSVRVTGPGHQVAELMDFIDGQPVYAVTTNREAGISTGATSTRFTHGSDGDGFTVGIWDGGAVRASHQEFGTRVTVVNNVSAITHATHVAGTIAASGVLERSKGMSPAVRIDSYDWNSDKSEMTSRGASYPGEPDGLYISNHSYGYLSGWSLTESSTPQWEWNGQGTNQSASDTNFGRYNNYTRDMDSLAYNLPYYLTFWAAGNEGTDNPAQGASVKIGSSTYSYDSAIHPPGDGKYRDGYDTIGHESLAKNVMTVGSVNDAVTSGERDLAKASVSSFSSWGPTDDGRIKPDIVANGASLYSTSAGSDTAYSYSSGTSMSSPNASGSAQLLVSYFDQLFPGHAMRASTLKGLILHTADDLGTPGPDYKFGWGLMNTEAAADHLAAHQISPGNHHLVEARLLAENPVHTYTFTWDGVSPIRATLVWTDPAALSTNNHDDRTRRLVNNLDLQISAPDDSLHQPYVMPYVGDWRPETLSAPATTGKNNTDNIEQVFIAAPPEPGTYTATVSFDGNLTNDAQYYSLFISGSQEEAAVLEITSISPESASSSLTTMSITGGGFQLGANVALTFPNEPDRIASSLEITPNLIKARIDTDSMAGGLWDVVVTNPDGETAIFPASFSVAAPFWSEDFETGGTGWTQNSDVKSSNWNLSETASRSSTHAYFAPGPADNRVDSLHSPVIEIPADASDLAFSFWHSHEFASNHGGVLEFSLDGGPWFDPSASGSGTSFVTGSYNGSVSDKGKPSGRNALGSRNAWTGSQPAFSEVVITLHASSFAGKSFQARWRLGTNKETASPGWYIDDVALQGAGAAAFPTPQITVAPFATESPVTGTSVGLHLEAENSDGSDGITYTWTVNDSFEFPISFDENGTETANSTTANFSRSGVYRFEVTARNNFNQSASSTLELVVERIATTITVGPDPAVVPTEAELAFSAEVRDQFDLPLPEQPVFLWTIDSAAGTVTTDGVFTAASTAGGPFLLSASAEADLSGFAEVTIRDPGYTDWAEEFFTEEELAAEEISSDTADPDGDGVPNLLEYALAGNPRQPSRDILPKTELNESEAGMEMVFSLFRPVGLTDLVYRIEASSDLTEWLPLPSDSWEIETNVESEKIIVRIPLSAQRFLRLNVERR